MSHEKLHEVQIMIAAIFSIIKLILIEITMLVLMTIGAVDLIGNKLGVQFSSSGAASPVVSCADER